MKETEKEMLKVLDENFGLNNYEQDDFRLGVVKAPTPAPALTPVMGQAQTGRYVGEISLKIVRRVILGAATPNYLPVALGSPFSAYGAYRRVINQIIPPAVLYTGYAEDNISNSVNFLYSITGNLEEVYISSDYYDVISFLKGLHNIKALISSISITTPDNSVLISQFVNTSLVPFSESWLTKIDKDQRGIKIAAGQYNKNVFDLNVPVMLSPNDGFALSLPPIVNPDANVGDTYNVQMFFNTIQKF